ncbi:MAG: TylF/MycF family methyltransferase [Bacteroidota bacterium]|nr:TylF/MycF family methyltransferase [Bacteroidota bacterium]
MNDINTMYLELLKNVLSDYHRIDRGEYKPLYRNHAGARRLPIMLVDKFMRKMDYAVCKYSKFKKEDRQVGKDWPAYAETMIGIKRLNNIQKCAEDIFKNNIPGDFIETGVWRGGSTIFMKAMMKVHGVNDKIVWVADSFEGLPRPDDKYAADKGDKLFMFEELAIPMEVVKQNFEKYNLLDENVKFLKGWFKDTLHKAPIEKLSLLRLDGDLYESTMDALVPLYPKLSPGGYIIIDDYGTIEACKLAVHDYREKHGITEEIIPIDWSGVYWQKRG